MDFKIVNPTTTRSGGVMLLWKRGINIQLMFSHPNYIDVSVQESLDKVWRLTGVYGEPRWDDKYKTWERIRELHAQSNLPWVLIGDFNEILYSHEKEGGNPRPQIYMQALRDVLEDCNLSDLRFSGEPFTWRRGRIRERLDRGLANNAWRTLHPEASVHHLDYMRSDYRPILLETDNLMLVNNPAKSKKFEARWLQEDSF
jgi:endonuclease/exonuclease/phosphatase family metal-dependent hydrolase